MSMYNTVMGVNPLAGDLLSFLACKPTEFGRLRDVWLDDQHGDLRIVVHTRCGGGNRDAYDDMFKLMVQHPDYIRDYDCDFDDTYANIEFHLPESAKTIITALLEEADKQGVRDKLVDNRSQAERWTVVMAKLKNGE